MYEQPFLDLNVFEPYVCSMLWPLQRYFWFSSRTERFRSLLSVGFVFGVFGAFLWLVTFVFVVLFVCF